jgi:hypothetical protein
MSDPHNRRRRIERRRNKWRAQSILPRPDVNDPGYRARLADERRRLAQLRPDEDVMADGFARLASRTEGWR